jgi:hypothetical protein
VRGEVEGRVARRQVEEPRRHYYGSCFSHRSSKKEQHENKTNRVPAHFATNYKVSVVCLRVSHLSGGPGDEACERMRECEVSST